MVTFGGGGGGALASLVLRPRRPQARTPFRVCGGGQEEGGWGGRRDWGTWRGRWSKVGGGDRWRAGTRAFALAGSG